MMDQGRVRHLSRLPKLRNLYKRTHPVWLVRDNRGTQPSKLGLIQARRDELPRYNVIVLS